MTTEGLPITFPSTGALYGMTTRLVTVEKGLGLLKKKNDALVLRSRKILDQILHLKVALIKSLREGSMSLAEVKYSSNGIQNEVLGNVGSANAKICSKIEHIIGVQVTHFIPVLGTADPYCFAGLGRVCNRMSQLKGYYQKAIQISTQLATLQAAFITLNQTVRLTSRRINGISQVIIPRLKRGIAHIETELDEQERENLYRLKLVRKKQIFAGHVSDMHKEDESQRVERNNILHRYEDKDILF